MKRVVFFLLPLLAGLSWAQEGALSEPTPEGTVATTLNFPTEKVQTPRPVDVYCAGFLSKSVSKSKFVTGGVESPFTTLFGNRDIVYLRGRDYQAGQQYTIIRELRDPNLYELYPGQSGALRAAGTPYEDVARVRVIDTRTRMAVARIEFSCDTVAPGDLVVEGQEQERTEADLMFEALNESRLKLAETRREMWRAIADLQGLMQLDLHE